MCGVLGGFLVNMSGTCDCHSWTGALYRVDALTAREREVFSRLAEGGSNQEIADGLWITERTVRAHLRQIMRKLQLRSRLRACIASYLWVHGSICSSSVASDSRTRI